MIKGNLFQKMYKYTCWLNAYKAQLEHDSDSDVIPSNPELELVCTAADECAADCLAEDENDIGGQKLFSLIADVRKLMSERE